MTCRACNLVFEGSNVCPDCGTEAKTFGKPVEAVDGDLQEISKVKVKATVAEKRVFLGMLKYYVYKNGKNPKMVNGAYHGRYGVWPHHTIVDVAPIHPDKAFDNYMTYQRIKFAKSRKKAGVQ